MPKLLHGNSKLRYQSSRLGFRPKSHFLAASSNSPRYEPYISRIFSNSENCRPNNSNSESGNSKVVGHTANDCVNCYCALAEFFGISARCSYCEKYMRKISLEHIIWIDQQVKRLITNMVNNLSHFDQEIYYNSKNEARYEMLLDSEKCFDFDQYCVKEVDYEEICPARDDERDSPAKDDERESSVEQRRKNYSIEQGFLVMRE